MNNLKSTDFKRMLTEERDLFDAHPNFTCLGGPIRFGYLTVSLRGKLGTKLDFHLIIIDKYYFSRSRRGDFWNRYLFLLFSLLSHIFMSINLTNIW